LVKNQFCQICYKTEKAAHPGYAIHLTKRRISSRCTLDAREASQATEQKTRLERVFCFMRRCQAVRPHQPEATFAHLVGKVMLHFHLSLRL